MELIGGTNIKRDGSDKLYAPSPEACETECFVNKKNCAAWTFYQGSKTCYLILGDSKGNSEVCFHQQAAKRKNAEAVSGFICQTASKNGYSCWSTHKNKRLNVCPLPERDVVYINLPSDGCNANGQCVYSQASSYKLRVSSTVVSNIFNFKRQSNNYFDREFLELLKLEDDIADATIRLSMADGGLSRADEIQAVE